MTLTEIFLIIAGILYTEAIKDVHVAVDMVGCTDSDGEVMYGLDGEETGHADWKAQKFVMTLPAFADPFAYPESAYESALTQQKSCKEHLATSVNFTNSPAVAEAPPSTSVYPKSKMKTGVENTLVCFITAFYPPRLHVSWTRNNKVVSEGVSHSQLRVNLNDGSFTMFSTLQFTPHEGDMYTCAVQHSTLERPMTREFDVVMSEPSVLPTVLFGVGVGAAALGAAIGVFFIVKGNQCN
ncbi:H-2 class II histocompatibility antigen, I-E alpha chain-like [Sardina pilchardus]|uniref:H-2 class II histocompatibility antigen, I-E alpha chain-like n=1 Tax=Sardina pilchardus TaxID=27697 RepID=UPI002E15AAF8